MSAADRSAIERIARSEAAGVLDEAVVLARRQAAEQLAEQLTPAMVRAALDPAGPAEQPTGKAGPEPLTEQSPAEQPSAGDQDSQVGQYAYAITDAGLLDLREVAGLRDCPVELVGRNGLRLLVSDIPLTVFEQLAVDDLTEGGELAELARRHDEVIRAVAEQTTVLPLRFGTVLADRDAGERLLAERAEQARVQLAEFRAHQEWGVRVFAEPETDPEPGSRQPRSPEQPRPSGTDYLASRRQALEAQRGRRERTRTALSETYTALGAHAAAAVRRDHRDDVLLDAAFLVGYGGEQAFFDEVRRHAELLAEQGMSLHTTGPWPPYSFAELDTGAAADG